MVLKKTLIHCTQHLEKHSIAIFSVILNIQGAMMKSIGIELNDIATPEEVDASESRMPSP